MFNKTIIAGIIAASVSSAALAQNVSVYGIIDTGMQNYNNGTTNLTRATNSLFNSGRLGFRGTEDLGGGLKANFMLESSLTTSDGTLGSSSTTGLTFDREAWVGVSGGFGEVRMGRQDVSYAQDIDSGVSQAGNFATFPVNGTDYQLGRDQASVVKYTTPNLGGLTVQAGFSSNANGATTDAGTDQKSIHAKYEIGQMTLHAGYQTTDGATAVAERDFTAAGVSYNFGVASVGYAYGEGDTSTTGDVKSKGHVASVKVPLGKGFAAHGVYAISENGAQASDNSGKGYSLILSKELSKRTMIYTAYTSVTNEASSSMTMTGVTAPASAGLDTKSFTVALSHSF